MTPANESKELNHQIHTLKKEKEQLTKLNRDYQEDHDRKNAEIEHLNERLKAETKVFDKQTARLDVLQRGHESELEKKDAKLKQLDKEVQNKGEQLRMKDELINTMRMVTEQLNRIVRMAFDRTPQPNIVHGHPQFSPCGYQSAVHPPAQ